MRHLLALLAFCGTACAGDGFTPLRFAVVRVPYLAGDSISCYADSTHKMQEAIEVRTYTSAYLFAPDSLWHHNASWGARGKASGDTLRILAAWPDTGMGPLYLRVTFRNPRGEACRGNIVRVR